jgi:hypothetical protein
VLGAATFARLATPAVFTLTAAAWAAVGLGSNALAWSTGAGSDEPH